jgi:hypothetical protein
VMLEWEIERIGRPISGVDGSGFSFSRGREAGGSVSSNGLWTAVFAG